MEGGPNAHEEDPSLAPRRGQTPWLPRHQQTGGLTGGAHTFFLRAKGDLIASGRYIENDGLFWKLKPSAFQAALNDR